MVVFGMPLPLFLAVLLLAGGVLAGSIYFVTARNVRAAAKVKKKGDWSKDYGAFMDYLKDQEAERTKPENRGNYGDDSPYPPNWVTGIAMVPTEVEWQGVFQSVGESTKMLTFDLPTSYKTAGNLAEQQPGAEYTVVFFCAESSLAEWKAVAKGQKVRFSGLVGASAKGQTRPPAFLFSEGYQDKRAVPAVKVLAPFGGIHDPLNYIIQINVSDVKIILNSPPASGP
jgi:hypothetical protein